MEQTIIGAFDTIYRARAARDALISAGFEQDEISVQANDSDDESIEKDDADGSLFDGIGNFFSSLFGNEHEHVHHYAETVRRGGAVVAVTVEEAARAAAARAALAQSGAFDIEKRAAEWDGTQGVSTDDSYARDSYASDDEAADTSLSRFSSERSQTLPVLEESLEVGKREVDLGAVRVYARTVETPVEETLELREQHARIERQPVDREATADDLALLRGGLIEIRETEERPVISKTARVVEEVSIEAVESTRSQTISDTVRHTEVDVERDADAGNNQAWRNHYARTYAEGSDRYEDYAPAYEYGSSLASDQRYRNREWDDIEYDARSGWDSRYPESAWDRFKAAIRHGWESMTGKDDTSPY